MSALIRSSQVQRSIARAFAGVCGQHVIYKPNIFPHFEQREATGEDATRVEAFLALEKVEIRNVYGSSGKNV
jgi:hypothetical protein